MERQKREEQVTLTLWFALFWMQSCFPVFQVPTTNVSTNWRKGMSSLHLMKIDNISKDNAAAATECKFAAFWAITVQKLAGQQGVKSRNLLLSLCCKPVFPSRDRPESSYSNEYSFFFRSGSLASTCRPLRGALKRVLKHVKTCYTLINFWM